MNVSFYAYKYQIYRITKVKSTLNVLSGAGVVAVKVPVILIDSAIHVAILYAVTLLPAASTAGIFNDFPCASNSEVIARV